MTPSQQAKSDACKAKNSFRKKEKDPCQVCDACKTSPDECTLYPYSPNCCEAEGKTPHHVLPKHCFMPPKGAKTGKRYEGCEKYDPNKAPCICVTGSTKSSVDPDTGDKAEHGQVHDLFDFLEDLNKEDGKAGTWPYEEARDTAAVAVNAVFPDCDPACTAAQLDKYHQEVAGIEDDTALRADSAGKAKPADLKIKSNKTASRRV